MGYVLPRLPKDTDEETLDKIEAKVHDGLEQAWWHGYTGKPSPNVSKSLGYIVGEIKNVFHAAVNRSAQVQLSSLIEERDALKKERDDYKQAAEAEAHLFDTSREQNLALTKELEQAKHRAAINAEQDVINLMDERDRLTEELTQVRAELRTARNRLDAYGATSE